MIQNEVAILRRVKHPNIVLLIEEMDTYSELYLVMELVKVCTLYDVLLLVVLSESKGSIHKEHVRYDPACS